jgi:hydroxyacylglutathione hydrolase
VAVIPQVTVDELAARLEEDAGLVVLDVRRSPEYAAGHVPGAQNLPLDRVERDAAAFDSSRSTAVICAGGYRSSAAVSLLARRGFRRLFNVVGGMTAWTQAGHPVATVAAAARSPK